MAKITHHIRMHWLRFLSRTKWQFLLLVPIYVILCSYFLVGDRYLYDPVAFILSTSLNFVLVSSVFVSLDYLIEDITHRYPDLKQTFTRIVMTLWVVCTITPMAVLGSVFIYDYFHLFGYSYSIESLIKLLLMNLAANLISIGIYESFYSTDKWKKSMLEKEQLEKSNLQSQLDGLKSQVNPHFLFNSLNSLSSLIADEPEKAERFVDEMSKVYRYLLQTNEAELTPLSTELQFIQSYIHLLTTRYGRGISVNIDIEEGLKQCYLPPLTLQLLVENAVKHNITLTSKPLHIEIKTTPEGKLIVRNNLQKRIVRVQSNQVGLSNISSKYKLLAQRQTDVSDINIEETSEFFTVTLPLFNQHN
ncbi:sensor histidine kinase [Telluribacter humicola]|uniref:sensor histidine kinase n=1 Tax=Telluribacter humicola TaxID=1720261 RepID=UPI001A95A2DB|nr:histidine kinase [Telluribacter humicola]